MIAPLRFLQLVTLIGLFIGTFGVSSQHKDFLQGRLYDSKTGEGVPFATIRLEGKALGVVSNEDGGFLIPSHFRELGDFLHISSMGYESVRVPVASLQSGMVNRIALAPGIFKLSETVLQGRRIKKRTARNIVQTAIQRIPANYPANPFRLIGYYRDYQKKSDNYLNLNEAILEVNDIGFQHNDRETTRVRLYDYRENGEFTRDTIALGPYDYKRRQKVISNAYLYNYGGNEFSILRIHDALRNHNATTYSFAGRLDRDFIRNHNFQRLHDTHIDDVACYVIGFKARKGDYVAEGTIIIARHNFAIYQLNYALFDKSETAGENSKIPNRARIGQLMFSVRTEYRPRISSMYLNYISFRNNFRLTMPPKFAVDSIAADLKCGCFQVYFNKVPSRETALDLTNYKAILGGKPVKLTEARAVDYGSVLLYPPEDKRYLLRTLTRYSGKEVGADKASLTVKGVQDGEGNFVDVPQKIDMLQFREFFTQKILEAGRIQPDSTYMYKERPVFKGQPLSRPDEFKDYWMNTPLQDSK